jgi:hypothetical protein
MKYPTFYLLLALIFSSCFLLDTNDKPVTKIGEWMPIFNGKDLKGWETIGEFESAVKDGVLTLHATHPNNNAWVLTKKAYRNFLLECEFLMPDTTANSGVLIRYEPQKAGAPNATAYEANIDWRMDKQNVMGTLENAARSNFLARPNVQEWQKLQIEAKGDFLKVTFNGKVICETHNDRSAMGKIGLQVPIYQGDDIAFRNIRLKELPDETPAITSLEEAYRNSNRPLKPLLMEGSFDGWQTVGEGKWNFDGAVLHGNSGGQHSFLASDKTYQNVYLKCDFKIAKEHNSGIFIRIHPDSANISAFDGIECNIYDHNGFAHAYSTGSIVFHARAFSHLIDYEDWNTMEIFAKDEHIILTINGKKSAEAYLPAKFVKPGRICLQAGTRIFSDNGPSDIYFRNLQIKEMD